MNDLQVIEHENGLMVDSRDVAVMVGKDHKELLKSIRQYCEYLGEGKIPPSDFFIESTYISEQNKVLPNYLITKKGCDMIANKMTGEKGVLFTAVYVTKFEELEKANRYSMQELSPQLQLIISMELKQNEIQKQVTRQGEDIKLLAAKIENYPTDYYSIAGYASLRGIKVDISKARLLGIKASKISKRYEIEIGKVSDPRFGRVNTYHLDVLKELFSHGM